MSNDTPFNWEVSTLLKYERCHARMSNLAEFGGDCQSVCGVRTMQYGVSICTASKRNFLPGLVVKGYRKMCRTGMEVGVLIKLDSGQLGHGSCQLRSTLSLCEYVIALGCSAINQRFILSIGGQLCCPVEIPISVHNGQ